MPQSGCRRRLVLLVGLVIAIGGSGVAWGDASAVFDRALANGAAANEGFRRCQDYLDAWLGLADPATGLIPRNNAGDHYWNAKDAAADNYPFMVLTASFTDRRRFAGAMKEMLATEARLTSREGGLPDTIDLTTGRFRDAEPKLDALVFGASEYVKDGLLPLTEWLGPSEWSDRMIELVDATWALAPIKTPFGKIVSKNPEVNGEMLQTLSRLHWMTGERKYLDWATRLGDYYLLGDDHPTRDRRVLRLRDHGSEVVSGLCELYATLHFADPAKKQAYRRPLHDALDRILAVGRNEHGLFYNSVDPVSGETLHDALADTWGYVLNGYYTVYLVDGVERYRSAVVEALSHLHAHYRGHVWERRGDGSGADGYADSIESALNLYHREPVKSAAAWIDSEIRVMWRMQRPDGLIEGWHGDGNFARTTIMYCLWKTQGVSVHPWRADVVVGAAADGDALSVTLTADEPWEGVVRFDRPRHREVMRLPIDWPRINQFPEWFTVESERDYEIVIDGAAAGRVADGGKLVEGVPMRLSGGRVVHLRVAPSPRRP